MLGGSGGSEALSGGNAMLREKNEHLAARIALFGGMIDHMLKGCSIQFVHIYQGTALLLKFGGQSNMIGVVVGEYNGTQAVDAQTGFTQASVKSRARLGSIHTSIDQRPAIFGYKGIHIDGTQRKRDGDNELPHGEGNFARFLILISSGWYGLLQKRDILYK